MNERPTEILSVSYKTIMFSSSDMKNISPLEPEELHGKKMHVFPGIYCGTFSSKQPTKIHLVMGLYSLTLECNQIIYFADIFQHFRI